jgi:hypothetical protein
VETTKDLWEEEFPRISLRFGLLILGFQRTSLSFVFGEFVSTGRAGFVLKIFEFDNITEHKILLLKCVDDLSHILLFLLL